MLWYAQLSLMMSICCHLDTPGLIAVRLLMPGELSKHAVTEGTKAVTKATKDA